MGDAFDYTGLIAKGVAHLGGWRPAAAPVRAPDYDFAIAHLDPDSIPLEGLQEALGRALREHGGKELAFYPHAQGLPALRELIAEKLHSRQGMRVDPDQIVLTSGSGQAIGLFTQLLTDPGDTLLTEEFTYSGTLNIMRRFGARIVGVGLDEEGMRPDALDETIGRLTREGRKPKLIYTIPTFQNPTGADMGPQRRQDVLAVAQKHGVPIFEDDCYVDLRFEGDASPAIHSYDDTGMVLYSGSFSKTLAPGVRLGWLVAPPELIPRINALHYGLPTAQFAALATLYYVRDHGEEHVAELSHVFKSKRDTMLGAVGEAMGSAVVASRPSGGLFLWLRMREGVDTVALLEKARERGVVYGTGAQFSAGGEANNYLRLAFGHHTHQEIRDGIALLGRVFDEAGALG